VQEAFGIVIFAVVGLGAVAAVASLLGRSKVYEQIGRGGLALNEDLGPRPAAGGQGFAARERDDEIRQMLAALNSRRAARGEAQVDVEAELAELLRPRADPALQDEIRELVVARNARRAARGLATLDVEAEIERQISEL